MIISFNGLDGCGKSTQIENIHNKYYKDGILLNDFKFPLKIKKYNEKNFHDWWFNKSTIDEFCDVMYKGIKNRLKKIKSKKQIYLIDKGISNFDARIYATLRIKGINKKDALFYMKKYKIKYEIIDEENFKILLINNKKNNNKIYNDQYDEKQIKLYIEYRKYQEEFIEDLKNNNYYTFIYETKGKIDTLSKKIYNDINSFDRGYKCKIKNEKISNLVIPDEVKDIITEIRDYSKKILKKDLSGILIHGSISRKVYIPNWSDIDILVFVHKYDSLKFSLIDSFIKKYPIKIGITVFSDYEIKNDMLDAKSLYSIYSFDSGRINSMIYSNKLVLPKLSINDLKEKNKKVIPESLHKLKRLLYRSIDSSNFKEIYKLLTLVMKVDLINNHNIISKSYYQTFYNFSYIYKLDIINVDDFLIEKNCDILKSYGLKVINSISNGGYINE